MADLLMLSKEYRNIGQTCRIRLKELKNRLDEEDFAGDDIYDLRHRITMLTAMSRDCIATANFLKEYHERRERLDRIRKQA